MANCLECGAQFAPRSGQKFCSDSCRVKRYRRLERAVSGLGHAIDKLGAFGVDELRPYASDLALSLSEFETVLRGIGE